MAHSRKPWSHTDELRLRELAAAGTSIIEIAADLNRHRVVITRHLKKLEEETGLRLPSWPRPSTHRRQRAISPALTVLPAIAPVAGVVTPDPLAGLEAAIGLTRQLVASAQTERDELLARPSEPAAAPPRLVASGVVDAALREQVLRLGIFLAVERKMLYRNRAARRLGIALHRLDREIDQVASAVAATFEPSHRRQRQPVRPDDAIDEDEAESGD